MIDSGARESLLDQQFAVVEALTGTGPPPDGFDLRKFHVAADSLFSKRARSVARAWPAIATALGSEFEGHFRAYASRFASPPPGGAVADGRQFVSFLKSRNVATTELREATLLFDARCRVRSGRVRERRLAIKFALLRSPIRVLLVINAPLVGLRILAVSPLGRRRRSSA